MSSSEYSAVVVYVEDLSILIKTQDGVRNIIMNLKTAFTIKELGEPRFILGIEVTRDWTNRTLTLSQRGCIQQIGERFRMTNAKKAQLHTGRRKCALNTCY